MITVACVWTGTKYDRKFVTRLRAMVKKHLPFDHQFVCFTDHPDDAPGGRIVDITNLKLPGWWGKMALFNPEWRGEHRTIYFDLDTVIVGDLTPLAKYYLNFGICENFTRLAGKTSWPCRFGSCVMNFAPEFGAQIWNAFYAARDHNIHSHTYGDQEFIERMLPDQKTYLQDFMPGGFFLGYRGLYAHDAPPPGCAVVVYAGGRNPDNIGPQWALDAWKESDHGQH